MHDRFVLPTQEAIVDVLKRHPLIRLKEEVVAAFVVGSFAKGTQHDDSDVDVLLEVLPPRLARTSGLTESQLEDHYRQALRQYFVTHDIRGKADDVHPQWCGRRVDVYFTYDASRELRPKIRLESKQTSEARPPRRPRP